MKRYLVIAFVAVAIGVTFLSAFTLGGQIRRLDLDEDVHIEVGEKYLVPRKADSLIRWKSRRIGNNDATKFGLARTAFLVTCDFPLSIKTEPPKLNPDGSVYVDPDRPPIGTGTATAITSDGYWLTAAHALNFKHSYLAVSSDNDDSPYDFDAEALHPARVVWIGGKNDLNVPDLALIHSTLRPEKHFPLLRPPLLSIGDEVLSSGFGPGIPEQSGGVILRRGPGKASKSGARWMVYLSDTPIVPGDSGGPLYTSEGQLLGVNVSVHFELQGLWQWRRLVDYRARTVCPDTDWIRKLILKDRAEHKEHSISQGHASI